MPRVNGNVDDWKKGVEEKGFVVNVPQDYNHF